jgi:cytochrome c oxidase subunit 2
MTSLFFMDAAEPWQYGFQDPGTHVMEGIINFHHDIMFFLIIIVVAVGYIMTRIVQHYGEDVNPVPTNVVHGTTMEIVWTVTPAILLMIIAVPSFALLYSMDEVIDPAMTLKVVGHQWYWSYEYSDYESADGEPLAFDSYMIADEDLELGQLRLLEVDNRVVVPANTHIRVIITSADVLHCWGIAPLAMKMDACPGRLNQTSLFIKREGVYYGQCSEICGVNHGFMPIVVEAVSLEDYVSWISSKIELAEESV